MVCRPGLSPEGHGSSAVQRNLYPGQPIPTLPSTICKPDPAITNLTICYTGGAQTRLDSCLIVAAVLLAMQLIG